MALLFPTRRDKRCVPPVPGKHSQVHFRQANFARVLAGDPQVGGHGDFQSSANAMAIDRGNHQFRRVLQAKQHFVGMKAEIIFECGIHTGKHFDIRARGEKLISRSGEDDHIDIVVNPGLQNCLIQLAIHFVGISVGWRIGHLDHSDAASVR